MRTASALLCICVCVSAVYSQGVDTTLVLPDSLGPLNWPQVLFYDSINQTVFLGGGYGHCLLGIDPLTCNVKYRIGAGEDVRAICQNATDNKVYTADRINNTVTVIEGATGQAVKRIPVGLSPFALAWNSATGRLYCVNDNSANVSVIDCVADSVVATVGVGQFPTAVCINPVVNKIYVANSSSNTVSVIDGSTNSVVATVPVGSGPWDIIYNPLSNKVYTADMVGNTVTIINSATDSVITALWAYSSPRVLCFNPTNNKVYCSCEEDDFGVVIDGAGDTIIATPFYEYCADLVYYRDSNRVYAACPSGDLYCLDGAGDTLLADGGEGGDYEAVCYDPVNNQVFCANYAGSDPAVYVYDGNTLDFRFGVGSRAQPRDILYNPIANKAYTANGMDNSVTVVDGATNAIVARIPVGVCPDLLALDATDNKLYCVNRGASGRLDSTVSVIDCSGDSVAGSVTLRTQPELMVWNPALNRLYCANYDSTVTVLDCATDSILGEVPGGLDPVDLCVDVAGARVYAANNDDSTVVVIDALGDTLLGVIELPNRPTAMAYNSHNDHVYCALYPGSRVLVIGGAPPAVIDTIVAAGYGKDDMCYVPGEDKMYMTNSGSPTLEVIDCSIDSVIKRLPAFAHGSPLICDTLSRRVFSGAAGLRAVSVVDAILDSAIATVTTGDVVAMAWNANNMRVYTANRTDCSITVIRDSVWVGVKEGEPPAAGLKPQATVVRGVLELGVGSRQQAGYRAAGHEPEGRRE